jgi:hypothetical protein
MSLEDLKAGDEVLLYCGGARKLETIPQIETVEQVTPSFITVKNKKFRKSDGTEHSPFNGVYSVDRIEEYTKEERDKDREKILCLLGMIKWDRCSNEELSDILFAIKRINNRIF